MPAVLDPDLLAATRGLTLAARHLVAGLLPGLHASRQPGLAREFAQFRAYQPGDEPRHIDWKLYARSDRYYVRESEIETAVTVRLILDATASMRHADQGSTTTKFELARSLAAALVLLARAQGDPVGFHAVTGSGLVSVPAGQTRQPTERILAALAALTPGGKWPATLARSLQREVSSGVSDGNTHDAREIVVFLGDLHEHEDEVRAALAPLRARRHELIVFHLVGRDELDFPFHGAVRFEDWETGQTVEADADAAREAWTRGQEQRVQDWRRAWAPGGRFEYLRFRLDEPPAHALRLYLRQRLGRR